MRLIHCISVFLCAAATLVAQADGDRGKSRRGDAARDRVAAAFQRIDTNGDGVITATEFAAARAERRDTARERGRRNHRGERGNRGERGKRGGPGRKAPDRRGDRRRGDRRRGDARRRR